MTRHNQKYTKEKLEEAVKLSKSLRDVMRHFSLSSSGGNCTHMSKRIKKYGINTKHFIGSAHNKGKKALNRKTPEEVFIHNPLRENREKGNVLARNLISVGIPYECIICKCDGIWQGKTITLHVDHIDGNWKNNLQNNLRFLCPNCHSQTETFSSKKRIICDGQNSSEMKPSILAALEA